MNAVATGRAAAPPTVPAQPAESRPPLTLRSLFAAHSGKMLLTYALFNLENGLRLAQPWVLGWAINDLLRDSYTGLMVFVVQHLAHLLIGSFRQMYDTRAFTAIYSRLASELIITQRQNSIDVSRVAARSALSREYVDFFERHVPLLIRSAYSVVGALVLLGWYDWALVPFCLALVLPAALLNAAYGRRTLQLSGRLHDELEREVDVIGQGDVSEVRRHFGAVARWRVRLSDAEAVNFAVMEVFVLGLMVAALVHFCRMPGVQPGDIFAVFRYVLMFIMGLDAVPQLVQQTSRLRDIGRRVGRAA